jgi:hypothetical protein
MRHLGFSEMENLHGGDVDCSTGLGAAAGVTVALVAATIVTGGAALFAIGAMAAFWGGSILSIGNCRDSNWS